MHGGRRRRDTLIKECGLLFPRAIGQQFRNQVGELIGKDHQLVSVIAPLLSLHEQICQRQSKIRRRGSPIDEVGETTRRLMTVW